MYFFLVLLLVMMMVSIIQADVDPFQLFCFVVGVSEQERWESRTSASLKVWARGLDWMDLRRFYLKSQLGIFDSWVSAGLPHSKQQ